MVGYINACQLGNVLYMNNNVAYRKILLKHTS